MCCLWNAVYHRTLLSGFSAEFSFALRVCLVWFGLFSLFLIIYFLLQMIIFLICLTHFIFIIYNKIFIIFLFSLYIQFPLKVIFVNLQIYLFSPLTFY